MKKIVDHMPFIDIFAFLKTPFLGKYSYYFSEFRSG